MKQARATKRILVGLLGLICCALSALWLNSFLVPFPKDLQGATNEGRRIFDRDGRLLARQTASDGTFVSHVEIDDVPERLTQALLSAEDQRFLLHPGVDPLAIARAGLKALRHGRVTSGASTITQQLARQTFQRPRSLLGKWQEMSLALRIERTLTKREILEQYLNLVPFGPNIRGVRAAADHYFGKPLPALDLSESATLIGLLRGPSAFDPSRHPSRATKERDRVLARMLETGFITSDAERRARSLPVALHPRPPLPGAHHWVRVVSRQTSQPTVTSTLSGRLQREVEALVAQRRRSLDTHKTGITSAAVVVLNNESGEILAYVGSPDFHNESDGGQNDGILALRQPGSSLKPFIYATAIDDLGFSPATLLPDHPTHFRASDHFYSPRNFDRKFRGAVRLRRALANSLNVPAVYTLEKVGGRRVLSNLRRLGLRSLHESAEHYGPALALGDGEVTLLDLAAAYAALARGGMTVRPRFILGTSPAPSERVFSPNAAALISEILSDDPARREAFGVENALDLPFPVAVKTGTSKGYRDAWTVGYTRHLTVAVWAGNFDGRPSDRMTGASATGPLFNSVFRAAARLLGPWVTEEGKTRPLHDVGLVQRPICVFATAGEKCAGTILEWFAPGVAPLQSFTEPGLTFDEALPEITFPKDGMVFAFDPAIPGSRQKLVFRTRSGLDPATLYLNGQPLGDTASAVEWTLRPGRFELYALRADGKSETVRFVVN